MQLNTTLDPKLADPFEAYHTVHRDKARLQYYVAGLILSHIVLVFSLVVVAMRPARVIIKDRIDGRPPQLSMTEAAPPVTATDARVFFMNMVQLRMGWDSLTVDHNLRDYLGQCVTEQRQLEIAHLEQTHIDDKQPEKTRLQTWISAGVQNTLVWPSDLEDVMCKPKGGLWHCYAQTTLVTQQLGHPDGLRAPPARLAMLGTLLEVNHTTGTPSGLVVGAMRQIPVPQHQQDVQP